MLTGGLHDRPLIAASLKDRACDLVGIGRPACVRPALARELILNEDVSDDAAKVGGYEIPGIFLFRAVFGRGIPLVGAGAATVWHQVHLNRLGRGLRPDMSVNWLFGLLVEIIWWGTVLTIMEGR